MKKIILLLSIIMTLSFSINAISSKTPTKVSKSQVCQSGEVTDGNGNVIGVWIKCPSGQLRIILF